MYGCIEIRKDLFHTHCCASAQSVTFSPLSNWCVNIGFTHKFLGFLAAIDWYHLMLPTRTAHPYLGSGHWTFSQRAFHSSHASNAITHIIIIGIRYISHRAGCVNIAQSDEQTGQNEKKYVTEMHKTPNWTLFNNFSLFFPNAKNVATLRLSTPLRNIRPERIADREEVSAHKENQNAKVVECV